MPPRRWASPSTTTVDCELKLTRKSYAIPSVGSSGIVAPHPHAQVPSHRSPSIERVRVDVKGLVDSPGWLDGFPEVGRCQGPWRGRWTKDLLDGSTARESNSLPRGAACLRL